MAAEPDTSDPREKRARDETMRAALGALWRSAASQVSRVAGWLADPSLVVRVRGYVVVAVGVLVVTKILHAVVGAVPGLPTEFSAGVLVLTMVLAMLVYRQSLAYLRRHEAEAMDEARRLRLSPSAARVGPSERTRVARERHWRARKASTWGFAAFLLLLGYAFGVKSSVRTANLGGEERPVIVPLVLPEATAQLVYGTPDAAFSWEPLDDFLTTNGAYFESAFPNEYPAYVMATALPLHLLFLAFCMSVTRSFAFAVAPTPQAEGPTTGSSGGSPTKELPEGDDGLDAAIDLADEIVGMV